MSSQTTNITIAGTPSVVNAMKGNDSASAKTSTADPVPMAMMQVQPPPFIKAQPFLPRHHYPQQFNLPPRHQIPQPGAQYHHSSILPVNGTTYAHGYHYQRDWDCGSSTGDRGQNQGGNGEWYNTSTNHAEPHLSGNPSEDIPRLRAEQRAVWFANARGIAYHRANQQAAWGTLQQIKYEIRQKARGVRGYFEGRPAGPLAPTGPPQWSHKRRSRGAKGAASPNYAPLSWHAAQSSMDELKALRMSERFWEFQFQAAAQAVCALQSHQADSQRFYEQTIHCCITQ